MSTSSTSLIIMMAAAISLATLAVTSGAVSFSSVSSSSLQAVLCILQDTMVESVTALLGFRKVAIELDEDRRLVLILRADGHSSSAAVARAAKSVRISPSERSDPQVMRALANQLVASVGAARLKRALVAWTVEPTGQVADPSGSVTSTPMSTPPIRPSPSRLSAARRVRIDNIDTPSYRPYGRDGRVGAEGGQGGSDSGSTRRARRECAVGGHGRVSGRRERWMRGESSAGGAGEGDDEERESRIAAEERDASAPASRLPPSPDTPIRPRTTADAARQKRKVELVRDATPAKRRRVVDQSGVDVSREGHDGQGEEEEGLEDEQHGEGTANPSTDDGPHDRPLAGKPRAGLRQRTPSARPVSPAPTADAIAQQGADIANVSGPDVTTEVAPTPDTAAILARLAQMEQSMRQGLEDAESNRRYDLARSDRERRELQARIEEDGQRIERLEQEVEGQRAELRLQERRHEEDRLAERRARDEATLQLANASATIAGIPAAIEAAVAAAVQPLRAELAALAQAPPQPPAGPTPEQHATFALLLQSEALVLELHRERVESARVQQQMLELLHLVSTPLGHRRLMMEHRPTWLGMGRLLEQEALAAPQGFAAWRREYQVAVDEVRKWMEVEQRASNDLDAPLPIPVPTPADFESAFVAHMRSRAAVPTPLRGNAVSLVTGPNTLPLGPTPRYTAGVETQPPLAPAPLGVGTAQPYAALGSRPFPPPVQVQAPAPVPAAPFGAAVTSTAPPAPRPLFFPAAAGPSALGPGIAAAPVPTGAQAPAHGQPPAQGSSTVGAWPLALPLAPAPAPARIPEPGHGAVLPPIPAPALAPMPALAPAPIPASQPAPIPEPAHMAVLPHIHAPILAHIPAPTSELASPPAPALALGPHHPDVATTSAVEPCSAAEDEVESAPLPPPPSFLPARPEWAGKATMDIKSMTDAELMRLPLPPSTGPNSPVDESPSGPSAGDRAQSPTTAAPDVAMSRPATPPVPLVGESGRDPMLAGWDSATYNNSAEQAAAQALFQLRGESRAQGSEQRRVAGNPRVVGVRAPAVVFGVGGTVNNSPFTFGAAPAPPPPAPLTIDPQLLMGEDVLPSWETR